jgi:hypothetical protein
MRADAPLPRRGLALGREAGSTSALDVRGQFTHRSPRCFDAVFPVDRNLRRVNGGEDFRAPALALDPQAERLLDHILGAQTVRSRRRGGQNLAARE